jgi:dTDP-glucose 4,6-dehydratase
VSGRVLVTGGLGFIGSAYVRALAADGTAVLNVDLDTYAGDERRLAGVAPGLVETVRMDVAGPELAGLVRSERPALIVHFAAETHVTRSEGAADVFFHANVEGTRGVLDAALAGGVPRVVHMSTDEVYGPCPGEPFREHQKLHGEGLATSAYARSKALADDLAHSYSDRLDVVIARPTNCIGPWQHPEKAVPRWATRALRGERLPVWGDGLQVRDWMFVSDAVSGLRVLAERGARGTAYNVGPAAEAVPNVEIARMVARAAGSGEDAVYLSEYDRPQHDRRYAISTDRIAALGWSATHSLEQAVAETVGWYRDHGDWWGTLVPEAEGLYAD